MNKEFLKEVLYRNRIIIEDCWVWKLRKRGGYGVLYINGDYYSTHRLSYYAHNENFDIDDPKQLILHKNTCHNPLCFNPEHLYVGTPGDNRRDSAELQQKEPYFRCGHPRTPENTTWEEYNVRKCKTCKTIRNKIRDKITRRKHKKRVWG